MVVVPSSSVSVELQAVFILEIVVGLPLVPVSVVPGRPVGPSEVPAGLTGPAPPPSQPQPVAPTELSDELILSAAVDGGQVSLLSQTLGSGLGPGPRLLDHLIAVSSILRVARGTGLLDTGRALLTGTPTLALNHSPCSLGLTVVIVGLASPVTHWLVGVTTS